MMGKYCRPQVVFDIGDFMEKQQLEANLVLSAALHTFPCKDSPPDFCKHLVMKY